MTWQNNASDRIVGLKIVGQQPIDASVTIDWGDGQILQATQGIVTGPYASRGISSNHQYAAAGTYTVSVTDGSQNTRTMTVTAIEGARQPNALAQMSPGGIPLGSGDTTVTMRSMAAMPAGTILCDGVPLPSTRVDATTIQFVVPASFLSGDSAVSMMICPVEDDGERWNQAELWAMPANPDVTLTSIDPSSITWTPGVHQNVTVTATGTGFEVGFNNFLYVGNRSGPPSPISTTQIRGNYQGTDVLVPGTLDAWVFHTAGYMSATTVPFTVVGPSPAGRSVQSPQTS